MATGRLAARLDRGTIADLAGSRSFQRGIDYLEDGRVGPITSTGDSIEATVQGERPYSARISLVGSRIVPECTCPIGTTGAFCKHCVALALASLQPPSGEASATTRPSVADRPPAKTRPPGRRRPRHDTGNADPVRPFLAGLGRDALADLIMAEMARDEALATRIRLRAALAAPNGGGLRIIERALDRATRLPSSLRYRDVPAFASDVHEGADALDQLVREGQPDAAIGLAERALLRLEKVLHRADDSDGLLGDLLERFQQIHLDACRAGHPDPVGLAERLVRWELDGDWDVFRGAAERYADVLGDVGLATYGRLAEAEWARIQPRGPGDKDAVADRGDRFSVTYLMESLARAGRDVDMEVAVMSRDLSSAYAFVRIAQRCQAAGRDDEALAWAEKGVRAFPSRTDVRLRELLAEEYLRRSRGDDAMALIWTEYRDRPGLEAYRLLKRYADRQGAWAIWRPRAIDEVRRSVDQAMAAVRSQARPGLARWLQSPDGSRLVDILLWEDDLEAAWDAARQLGCGRAGWLQLAVRSEETRPDDALAVYRQEVEAILQVTDKRAYAEAVDLLGRVRRLMVRLGRTAEFTTYAAGIRAANARRPMFVARFDATGLVERRPHLRVLEGPPPS